MKLLLAESRGFSADALQKLRAAFDVQEADLDRAGLLAQVADADILWVRLRNRIDAEVLAAARELKILVSPTTGLNHIDLAECERRGIRVVSLRGETEFLRDVRATAELTVGLILSLVRHLPDAMAHARDGGWDRDQFIGHELYGKTIGLVGYGRLGRIVARYLQAFDVRVLVTDPNVAAADLEPGIALVPLDRLLAESDLVSLHVNLTDETEGFFGRAEFAAMKSGAWFVNTSRGELVDEQALLDALRSGHLAAAALDVVTDESSTGMPHRPLVQFAQQHPGRLLITPHIGGCTHQSLEKTESFLAGRLISEVEGPSRDHKSNVTSQGTRTATPDAAVSGAASARKTGPAPPRRSYAYSSAQILATQLATYGLSIITSLLVAWALGAADRGIYSILLLIGSLAIPIGALGFNNSIMYYVSNRQRTVGQIALTSILVALAQATVFAGALGLLWKLGLLGAVVEQVPSTLFIALLLLMPLQMIDLMLTRALVGDGQFGWDNLLQLGRRILSCVLLIVLVVWLEWGLTGAVAAIAVTELAMFAALVVPFWWIYRPSLALDTQFLRDGFHYGFRAWPGALAQRATLRIDHFLLGYYVPAAALGNYSIATLLSELPWMVPAAVQPLFNRIAGETNVAERAAVTGRVHRTMLLLMTLAVLALGAICPWVIPMLLGEDYWQTPYLLLLLLPGTLAGVSQKLLSKYFAGIGQPGRNSITFGISAIVGAVLYLTMIPLFGTIGAAIACSCAYISGAVFTIWLFRKSAAPHTPKLFLVSIPDANWLRAQVRAAIRPNTTQTQARSAP